MAGDHAGTHGAELGHEDEDTVVMGGMGGHSTTLSLPACPHPAWFWHFRAMCDPSSAAAGTLTSPHPAPGGCSRATGPFSTLCAAHAYFL